MHACGQLLHAYLASWRSIIPSKLLSPPPNACSAGNCAYASAESNRSIVRTVCRYRYMHETSTHEPCSIQHPRTWSGTTWWHPPWSRGGMFRSAQTPAQSNSAPDKNRPGPEVAQARALSTGWSVQQQQSPNSVPVLNRIMWHRIGERLPANLVRERKQDQI